MKKVSELEKQLHILNEERIKQCDEWIATLNEVRNGFMEAEKQTNEEIDYTLDMVRLIDGCIKSIQDFRGFEDWLK